MQMPAPALPRNPVSAELEWMTAIVKSRVIPTARSGATETMSNRLPAETPASVVMETETASAASVRPGARDGVGVEGGGAVRSMEAELAVSHGRGGARALCQARRFGAVSERGRCREHDGQDEEAAAHEMTMAREVLALEPYTLRPVRRLTICGAGMRS